MDNPEKLATLATKDKRRRQTTKDTTQKCIEHQYMQTNTHNANKI